jgi:hypothetical protein
LLQDGSGFFLEFNQRLVETYASIFGAGTNGGANSGFGEKWGWFIAIKRIGREYRLTPYDVVERFNINEFLTEIEYLDDEYKEQEKQIKNAKRNI